MRADAAGDLTMSRHNSMLVTAMAIAASGGSAFAGTFSFASDIGTSQAVLSGAPGDPASFIAEGVPRPTLTLGIDLDDDGPGLPSTRQVTFELAANMIEYQVVPVGVNFLHMYRVTGAYAFRDAATLNLLMRVDFPSAVFSSISESSSTWSSSASISATAPIAVLAAPELGGNAVASSFAFGLTNVRQPRGGRVSIATIPAGRPTTWIADSSWTMHTIPQPGPLALGVVGAAMVLGARRRR